MLPPLLPGKDDPATSEFHPKNLPLNFLQLLDIKTLIPADIYEDLNSSVEFQQGLRCCGCGLRA